MINQEKVKIMTKLAIYEDKKGKDELKVDKYYKSDYIRLQVIKAFLSSTIGSILVVILLALYNMEYLILNLIKLDFTVIGKYILLIYIIVSVFYAIIAATKASTKYEKSRKNLSEYRTLLNKLRKMYAMDNVEKE